MLSLGSLACGGGEGGGDGFASGTYPAPTTVDPTAAEDTGDEDDSSDDESTGSTGGVDPTEDATTTFDPPDTDSGTQEGTVDAFRFTELIVRDPHFFGAPPLLGCIDITDGGDASVNGVFAAAIAGDDPMAPDGLLDLNLMLLFEPLDQTAGITSQATFANAACTAPAAGTSCGPAPASMTFDASYTNMAAGAMCLTPDPTLLGGYTPQPLSTAGPCMHAGPTQIQISTAVFTLNLDMVEIAAQYDGEPTGGLISGSVKGFISRQVAETTMLPADLAELIGASNVAGLLAGHGSNCKTDVNDMDGDGWWMHADFKAARVPWTP